MLKPNPLLLQNDCPDPVTSELHEERKTALRSLARSLKNPMQRSSRSSNPWKQGPPICYEMQRSSAVPAPGDQDPQSANINPFYSRQVLWKSLFFLKLRIWHPAYPKKQHGLSAQSSHAPPSFNTLLSHRVLVIPRGSLDVI